MTGQTIKTNMECEVMGDTIDKEVPLYIVNGVEGKSVYLCDVRMAGNKPWGGGQMIKSWHVNVSHVIYALRCGYSPSSQPLRCLADEINDLCQLIGEDNTKG